MARAGDRLDAEAGRLGALAVPADLATPDGPAAAVAAAVDAFGGLDLLVVNSGGPPLGRFEDLDEAAWQTAIDGTLLSALRLLRAALPHLREGRDPAIVIVLSSRVREPIPALTTSNLIRPGLAGLIKSLVHEIAPVRINGLAPGRLSTDRIAQLDAARVQNGRGPGRGDPAPRRSSASRSGATGTRRARPGRGVPALAGRVVRHRGDRAGRWRDGPRAA